ncbi:hypothetical protein [Thiohalomonas denitrificans]|uniref:Uncharacterized protein n=1 Tax=Thiohalomonas denitrificans TaxID=415747 RepID=A0A1G5PS21_9GAMM|nr:hypothetical protein [Thiohalomonas denitrificans]SCZ52116.1 hypothetical protein SAMN03097708_00673 [Thiohalomonas denitrificans]
MDKAAIVRKTHKGEEELRSRAHGLAKELRHVLILVDGRSSVEQLAEKGGEDWDVQGRLVELAREGFVSIDGMSAEVLESDIAGIRDQLVLIAQDVLGEDATKVVQKLNAAPETREGLLKVTAQCKKLVLLLIDEDKAEELERRCQGALAVL